MVPSRSAKETSEEESSCKKKLHKEEERFLMERQIAWMICEYFQGQRHRRICLGLDEILKVELGEWNETIIASKEQDNVYDRQLEQSQQLKHLL